jgi:hypothetical protein
VNGEVVSKEKISEEITKKPVDEIIKVGTKKTTTKKSNTKSVTTGKTKAKDFSYSKKFQYGYWRFEQTSGVGCKKSKKYCAN